MNNLVSIPTDIRISIIEFLSIDDCFALQSAKRELFNQVKSSFWARKVFEKHIQHPEKLLNLLKCSDSQNPYFVPSSIEFNDFLAAKTLWQNLLNSKKKVFNFFVSINGDNQGVNSFVNRIYKVLSDPPLPMPVMRRENQYDPASSNFEAFLSDISFGIHPTMNSKDKDYLMLKKTCELMESDADELQIYTPKGIRSPRKSERRSSRLFSKRTRQNKKPRLNGLEKKKSSGLGNKNVLKADIEAVKVQREGFIGVQNLVKSHCKIIKNYLLSLREDKVVLKEYQRCWKEFTYSMIELNCLMRPYEELLASTSSRFPQKNMQASSFWRGMIKFWIKEVYNKLAFKLKSSFQSLSMDVSAGESTKSNNNCSANLEENEKKSKLLKKSSIALSDINLCINEIGIAN